MTDQQTQTVVPILQGTTIKYGASPPDFFVMDKACSVKVSELFRKDPTTNKIDFKVVDDVLDLNFLHGVRRETGQERFLPEKIFVRKSLQNALERRLHKDRDRVPTVVFGSPGIGNSVFAFLAAIASASTGRHKAVMYVRKVGDENENTTSAFWMTKSKSTTGDEMVDILASRDIRKATSIDALCAAIAYYFFNGDASKFNSPTSNGVKIIVDGPRYGEERFGGSDLVTSGGCPPQKQENRDEWHFPIAMWTFDELFLALKSLKKCNRCTVEEIFDTTGGNVRLALDCCSDSGRVNEDGLKINHLWMKKVVEAQGNDFVVKMAYSSSQLSADKYSLDRLRSMDVKEPPLEAGTRLFFETTLVLASAHIARLLWSKLSISEVHKAMIYARSTGNRSLFGWHFELWGHKLSEVAIDRWREQVGRMAAGNASASAPVAGGAAPSADVPVARGGAVGGIGPAPSAGVPVAGGAAVAAGTDALWPAYIQATGTGVEGVAALTAMWLYWKPSIPNFANIDAAILLGDGTLVCIQFTVSNEHGFDIRSFLHGFVFNIPEEVRSKIKKIKVIFVVPSASEVTFSAVRVPLEQKGLFESYYAENLSEKSKPTIKFVKQVVVPKTGNNDTDMDGEDSDVVSYDESLDGELFSVDTSTMDIDSLISLKVEFETRVVALNSNPGDFPFFALPDPNIAF